MHLTKMSYSIINKQSLFIHSPRQSRLYALTQSFRPYSSPPTPQSTTLINRSSLSQTTKHSSLHHQYNVSNRLFATLNNTRIKEVKQELLDSIQRDVNELTADDEQQTTVQDYVRENDWTLEEDPVNNDFTLRKKLNNSDIVVKFDANPDHALSDEVNDTSPAASVDEDENESMTQSEVDDEQHTVQPHTIYIDIHGPNKEYVRIYAYADSAGQLSIDKLNFSQDSVLEEEEADADDASTTGLQERNELHYNDLLEEVQETFQRYLEEMGIDDRLALFVQEFTFAKRTEQQVEKLNKLANIVKSVP